MDRAFRQQDFRQLLDHHGVDDGRGHRGVAEHVLLDARRFDDVPIEADQDLTVREEERRVGLTITRSRTRRPAGAAWAEPSSKRLTFRHSWYFLSMTHSIQIGMEAIPIWMKYPASSIISVKGAVRTSCFPRFVTVRPLALCCRS